MYKAIIFDIGNTLLCAKKAGMECAWLASPDSVLPDSVPYKEDYRIGKLGDLLTSLSKYI